MLIVMRARERWLQDAACSAVQLDAATACTCGCQPLQDFGKAFKQLTSDQELLARGRAWLERGNRAHRPISGGNDNEETQGVAGLMSCLQKVLELDLVACFLAP